MKALCVAALAALMAWAPTLAGTASAEDELGFNPLSVRLAFFQADEENQHDRVCLVDVNSVQDFVRCCPIMTSDISMRYSILELRADGSSDYGINSSCVPRIVALSVPDADS